MKAEQLQAPQSPISSQCWQGELTAQLKLTAAWKFRSHPQLFFFFNLMMEAPLLSGTIREIKHLVPYVCRLFGNSDAAISWHGVAYTLPVNYHHDSKTGSKTQMQPGHKGGRKVWGEIRGSLLVKVWILKYTPLSIRIKPFMVYFLKGSPLSNCSYIEWYQLTFSVFFQQGQSNASLTF